jgi:hypothetical protein
MNRKFIFISGVAAGIAAVSAWALGPTFRPENMIKGSALTGWHTLGKATWKAANGEVTGTPTAPEGGWLMTDQRFEDVAMYADAQCASGCKFGMLVRAEKTGDGMKGVFVSFTPDDLGSFAVTLDASGNFTSKTKLPPPRPEGVTSLGNNAGGRGGATTGPQAQGGGRGRGPGPAPQLPAGVNLDMKRPTGSYKPGDWNGLEVLISEHTVSPRINGGTLGGNSMAGGVTEEQGRFGPIAFYVGGTAGVTLKNVSWNDLLVRPMPKETLSSKFRMQRLDSLYYSWSAAIADINHDGKPDVIAGPYWYAGPDFTSEHAIYQPTPYNPYLDYPQVNMVSLAYDFTGDGWPDLLLMSGNAGNGTGTLYVNPKGESRMWDHYVVLQPVGNEETLLEDIDGDGKPEVIHAGDNCLRYSKPDPANPTGKWITKTISEPGPWGVNIGHGLGIADINGDGRKDYVNAYGWWEQPPAGSGDVLWKWHPQAFGRWGASAGGAGGAAIGIYDVNGDGLVDVVTSMEGHTFGLGWYEQKKDKDGNITWIEHPIMNNFLTKNAGDVTFTEPHATAFADIDGDGIPDFITGKRSLSHLGTYSDPDPFGPAVLYVYRVVRNKNAPGGAEFVPELVHNRSGAGSHFAVGDLNGDGKPDIVTSGVFGTFIFFNEWRR